MQSVNMIQHSHQHLQPIIFRSAQLFHFQPQGRLLAVVGALHELGETLRYGIAPTRAEECPWRMGPRAPLVGEHNEAVFCGELGVSREELRTLKESGVI